MKHIGIRSYIKTSIHVALSLLAFCNVFAMQQGVDLSVPLQCAIFGFGWVAYQYFHFIVPALVKEQRINLPQATMLFGAIAIGFYGLVTQATTVWVVFGFVAVITTLYTLPFGAQMGLRYIPTLKIFIVALCWSTLATFELYNVVSFDFILIASKAILWILVLIVPLEIHDLNRDAPRLKTLPQVLGVRGVKLLSYTLILLAIALAFMTGTTNILAWVETGMLALLGILIFKVKRDQPKHLTSLYVEAIPMLWLGLSYLGLTYC
jgi:hypothetical protein